MSDAFRDYAASAALRSDGAISLLGQGSCLQGTVSDQPLWRWPRQLPQKSRRGWEALPDDSRPTGKSRR